jgi:outer membrane protein OmpA-like peptidoglycan-associated protein
MSELRARTVGLPLAVFMTALMPLFSPPRPALAIEERLMLSAGPSAFFYDSKEGLKDGIGLDVHAAGYVNRWIGLEGLFSTASPTLELPATGSGTFTHFGGGLIVTPDRTRSTLPYLYAGLGSAKTEDASGVSETHGAFHVGGGIVVRAGDRLGFQLDGRDVSFKQGAAGSEIRVNNVQITGALTAFWVGTARDTDHDGVPDKRDKSPDTPAGAVVDASGRPLDSDHDGVFDGLDKQPGTPSGARVTPDGVAIDTDHDGVPDGIDKCDSTATGVLVDAQGCGLDSDGDQVYDGLDACPNTPAGAVVDEKGCPMDQDRDGVADGIDICPNTPMGMAVNAGGCPITHGAIERELTEDWLIRLTDLEFAPDSAALTPRAMARLDEVAAVLAQWPMLRIEIGVHVDDRTEPGYRIPLSQMRVRSVLLYLLQKEPSLNQKNYWITGYGDTDPLLPNTSSANRAQNRRVEFRVLNPNVLYQEKVKRESFGSSPVAPSPGPEAKQPVVPQG